LKSADAVMTYGKSKEFLKTIGCKNIEKHDVKISPEFNPNGEQFGWFDKTKRKILFFGKPTKYKGIIQLLEAFRNIKDGRYHLYIFGQKDAREYQRLCNDRVFFNPAIAPWSVPKILRSIDLFVAPECFFGVQNHTSRIPLEAILCGANTLISEEIAEKYPYKELKGLFTEINPLKIDEFTKRIIENSENPKKVDLSDKQKQFINEIRNFDGYLLEMEGIFNRYAK